MMGAPFQRGIDGSGVIGRQSLNVAEILSGKLSILEKLGLEDRGILAWLGVVLGMNRARHEHETEQAGQHYSEARSESHTAILPPLCREGQAARGHGMTFLVSEQF